MRMLSLAVLVAAFSSVSFAGAPAFYPGEQTDYKISYLRIKTGEARIVVNPAIGQVWPVVVQGKTGGIASIVDVREHIISYWDSEKYFSHGMDLQASEMGDRHSDRYRLDRDLGKATMEITRANSKRADTYDIPRDTYDLPGVVLWMRTQRLEPGDRIEKPVFISRKVKMMAAEVLGRERIETDIGEIEAVKVRLHLGEINGKFATSSDPVAWFSDDPRHILLKFSADFAVGSIVLQIKAYKPGKA